MKRFLLFACRNYYPNGGWGDFVDSYETQEAAEAIGRLLVSNPYMNAPDGFHVVDTAQAPPKIVFGTSSVWYQE